MCRYSQALENQKLESVTLEKVNKYKKNLSQSSISNIEKPSINAVEKIAFGKNLLPGLHDKTHFKGASTLLTDSREIKGFYNDAKLRSRFKALEKSVTKSRSINSSLSIDLGSRDLSQNINLYENESSIPSESKSTLLF